MIGAAQKSRRSVWIVDDSPLDAERARRALHDDYCIQVFDDGATVIEALCHAGEALPDVLVLDWMMPGVSGLEVCHYLRSSSDDALRRIAVLLLTVHQRTQQVVEGLEAGASDFLSKPYAEDELRARVGALVRNRALIERAERAERALEHLLANSPDALIGIDDRGRIAYANPEAMRILEPHCRPIVGAHIEDCLPGLRDTWSITDNAEPVARSDIELDGQLYAPVVRSASTGANVSRVVSLRNVTLQRQAERRRLDFYSVIAHDLRSPLSAALLRLEVMLRGISGPIAPPVHQNLVRMQRSMRELIVMINDFLDLARYESGVPHPLNAALVDIIELVDETIEDSRPLVDASHLTLHLELDPPGSLHVRGDRHRLKQVLGNLLANAIKFTPAGGTVSVIAHAEPQGMIAVAVQDTGRGIDPERLPHIFDRYSRALDDEHEVAGSGLGLMIVREIVRAHHGTVEVESTRGVGSTFRLRLPLAATAPSQP